LRCYRVMDFSGWLATGCAVELRKRRAEARI